MVACDTIRATPSALPANGLCAADHSNTSEQYLQSKGLTIFDLGTQVLGVAYALISHGATGYGGWMKGGQRIATQNGTEENLNAGNAGTYYRLAASEGSVSTSANNYFDDVVTFMRIDELARRSYLVARDWPDADSGFLVTKTGLEACHSPQLMKPPYESAYVRP